MVLGKLYGAVQKERIGEFQPQYVGRIAVPAAGRAIRPPQLATYQVALHLFGQPLTDSWKPNLFSPAAREKHACSSDVR